MKTVFLIDDDGLMRKMMARLFKKEKYRVRTFASAIGVLDRMAEETPDLIITDVQMPGMSGLQFLENARAQGYRTPVLIMTGFMGPDVVEQARELGVSHVFQKPIKDLSRLRRLVQQILNPPVPDRNGTGLDRLRLEFLTGLSHELRTPLTAVKLALDGLFAEKIAGLDSTQNRLLGISQRNVDRIIGMVEKQLDLLQITLGEVSVARRLVDLGSLFDSATKPHDGSEHSAAGGTGHGVYLFTDPERLRTVIQCLVELAATDPSWPSYEVHKDNHEITIKFRKRGPAMSDTQLQALKTCDNQPQSPFGPGGTREFEFRACRCLMESLGGTIEMVEGERGEESVNLRLPVLPAYDHTLDFVSPVRGLRKAAELSDKQVSFFRCDVGGNGSGPPVKSPNVQEFLRRCSSALSQGDVLVRGQEHGTYYLALVERRSEEMADIVEFLRHADGESMVEGTGTVRVETIPAGKLPEGDPRPIPEVVSS